MALFKGQPKRKASGGRYHLAHKKKARQVSRDPVLTTVKPKLIRRILRCRGANKKVCLQGTNTANLIIDGKAKKTKIETVVENTASRHFVRQNVISKGAVIKTPEGLARVTSRPTQDGVVNAVLVKRD